MKLHALLWLPCYLMASSALAQTSLLKNINGYTMENGKLVKFHAIKYSDDTIDKIFKDGETLPSTDQLQVIDGKQKTVLPGLIDAHGHVLNYGLSLIRANLVDSTSEQDAVSIVSRYSKQNPTIKWLQGRGWNQERWENKSFPSASSLDRVIADKPVVLARIDGHAIWVNSKAMQLANIDRHTDDVDGGEIVRDSDGNPTGVFIDNAMQLVYDTIPDMTVAEKEHALTMAMQSLAAVGLTSVHDAGINSDNLQAYKNLSTRKQMPIRINAMLDATDPLYSKHLNDGHVRSDDDTLVMHSVKISADGALGSRGAALIEDYTDKPHHKGLLLHSKHRLTDLVQQAMQAGFQVNTHAIGDDANKLVLDTYQQLIQQTQSGAMRHRVEHAQVLQLSDIPRFAELNIIASMQATHATSDKNMAEDRLGNQRIKGAYAWRSLLDSGAVIAAGSDFPVEYPNPFFGLHASVTRQDHANQPRDGWYKNEAMTLTEAFNSFTLGAAYAGHQENIIGSLEAGKKADFIIVDRDIFSIDSKDIWKTQVLATYVNGQPVKID
ncbi:amidohydrolase family protein [Thalassotalea ponticola]|uniref:amidohydrolase n=1 Tax=Thalassotalea ponticola TaxID=1523392 RepID=UPI0025B53C00|nr:amidohydrolase family protein [Thalassotalea ponticola]MDN3653219.1 amidohydrolase family protein [Thalassotalea ponticola]